MALSFAIAKSASRGDAAGRASRPPRSISSSAARSSTAMSASLKLTPWNLPIDCPNCTRSTAHCLAELERPLGAAQAAGGHLQARRAEPGVGDIEALVHLAEHGVQPHAAVGEAQDAVVVAAVARRCGSRGSTSKPGCPCRSGTRVICLRGPRRASPRRRWRRSRMTKSAWSAWLMKCLVPLMTKSLAVAAPRVVFMPRRSEPAPGSVIARQSYALAAHGRQQVALALRARCRPAGCWRAGPRSSSAARSWPCRAPSRRAPR